MKRKYFFLVCFSLVLLSCNTEHKLNEPINQATEYDISMYAEATKGSTRYIIELPTYDNESDYEVEIWAGKTIEVDCNQHKLVGSFKKEIVKGWGYHTYHFNTTGQLFGTRMLCPDQTLTAQFIKSSSERLRYNSKLPIVIYCPEGFTIEYAIWSKGQISQQATPK